jgi:hypothetical protein
LSFDFLAPFLPLSSLTLTFTPLVEAAFFFFFGVLAVVAFAMLIAPE